MSLVIEKNQSFPLGYHEEIVALQKEKARLVADVAAAEQKLVSLRKRCAELVNDVQETIKAIQEFEI